MPTNAYLLPHVHATRVGDDLVVLDVAADRYFCLPSATGLALSDDRRRLSLTNRRDHAELEAAGLLSRTAIESPAALQPPPPLHDLWTPEGPPARTQVRDFLLAAIDGALVYPRRAFTDLLAYGAERADTAAPDAPPNTDMRNLVTSFNQWACWIPTPAKCLIRSFVLLRLLRRHGFDARWVFAVRTWPFEAHCWLQADTVVLDDARDRLTSFVPILVV
ncbi:MAG: hypothetical protein JWM33_3529 [Caulobacteraceae bacterium]|nr:hypothetical protein [Caulobacteraceae bacterium]